VFKDQCSLLTATAFCIFICKELWICSPADDSDCSFIPYWKYHWGGTVPFRDVITGEELRLSVFLQPQLGRIWEVLGAGVEGIVLSFPPV